MSAASYHSEGKDTSPSFIPGSFQRYASRNWELLSSTPYGPDLAYRATPAIPDNDNDVRVHRNEYAGLHQLAGEE
jgi:hypothetical protein